MIIRLEKEWDMALKEAIRVVKNKGVFIYPTDTVYGIGGNAFSKEVVERINKIKGRERKPYSVLVGNLEMVIRYFEVGDYLNYITQYLPGPYTFLLKPKIKMAVSNDLVGLRVPDHYFIRKVSIESGLPIITTSANKSGERPPSSIDEIDESIIKSVDLVIDGGESKHKEPSTVVDLINKKILRQGAGLFKFQ